MKVVSAFVVLSAFATPVRAFCPNVSPKRGKHANYYVTSTDTGLKATPGNMFHEGRSNFIRDHAPEVASFFLTETDTNAFCSGVVLSERLVLTNKHCSNAKAGSYVRFGWVDANSFGYAVEIEKVEQVSDDKDWKIVRVKEDISNYGGRVATFPSAEVKKKTRFSVTLLGHPDGCRMELREGRAKVHDGFVKGKIVQGYLTNDQMRDMSHNLGHLLPGSSGAPIYHGDEVIGIEAGQGVDQDLHTMRWYKDKQVGYGRGVSEGAVSAESSAFRQAVWGGGWNRRLVEQDADYCDEACAFLSLEECIDFEPGCEWWASPPDQCYSCHVWRPVNQDSLPVELAAPFSTWHPVSRDFESSNDAPGAVRPEGAVARGRGCSVGRKGAPATIWLSLCATAAALGLRRRKPSFGTSGRRGT